MLKVLVLNPFNKSKIIIDDIVDMELKDNFNFKYKIVDKLSITKFIDDKTDIIITEYLDDELLNNFYFELQVFTKSYMIPVVFIVDCETINKFPVSFIDDSSDFIYMPLNKNELLSRMKIAILNNSQMKNNIQIDRLTGVPNYKSFYRRYNEETLISLRYGRKLSIAMLKIENLPAVKEIAGWYDTDMILAEMSFIMKKNIREVDYIARYSYDKFIFIFPETESKNSIVAFTRMLEALKIYKYKKIEQNLPEIISNIAVCSFPDYTSDSVELIRLLNERADEFSISSKFEVRGFSGKISSVKKMLLVEDDIDIIHFMTDLLNNEEIELIIRNKYSDDIILMLEKGQIDIAVIDIMLPGSELDGYEIIERIRKNDNGGVLPILVITAKGGPMRIIDSGADDYLLKPFSADDFMNKINLLVNKNSTHYKTYLNDKIREILPTHHHYEEQIDPLTKLPTLNSSMERIKALFKDSLNFGVIYVNVAKYNEIELNYGEKIFDTLISRTSDALRKMLGEIIRTEDIIVVSRMWDNDFVIFLSPPRFNKKLSFSHLNDVKSRIENYIKIQKANLISRGLEYQFDFYYGFSLINISREIKFERLIHQNLKNAMMMAYDKESEVSISLQSELKECIQNDDFDVYFQPFIDLETLGITGYEALARGPQNSLLNRPVVLFNTAYQTNTVWEVERILRKITFNKFYKENDCEGKLLSINVEPKSFSDPEFRKFAEMNPLNLDFSKIILEITERSHIHDLKKFKDHIQLYKDCGFTIAIDDAGSGYASLYYIAEIKPDIIKLDISLVKAINENTTRRDIVIALVKFAFEHNIKVLAEGIETREELEQIQKIGVQFGQGFYFSPGLPNIIKTLDQKVT